jgi:hypothetical protein
MQILRPPLLVLALVAAADRWERASSFVVRSSSSPSPSTCHRPCHPHDRRRDSVLSSFSPAPLSSCLFFFPRKREEEKDAATVPPLRDEDKRESQVLPEASSRAAADEESSAVGGGGGFSMPPFFARRLGVGGGNSNDVGGGTSEQRGGAGAAAAPAQSTATLTKAEAEEPAELLTPEQQARKLRAEAERMRLEAERMDALLTLDKISRLERQISKKADRPSKPEELESMQNQLQALQTKLFKMGGEGSSSGGGGSSSNGTASSASSARKLSNALSVDAASSLPPSQVVVGGELSSLVEEARREWQDDVVEASSLLDKAPGFLKKVMAAAVDFEYPGDDASAINMTELALRLGGLQSIPDDKPTPVFTVRQLEARVREIEEDASANDAYQEISLYLEPEDLLNTTRVALLTLEYEYYFGKEEIDEDVVRERIRKNLDKFSSDEPWLVEVLNRSAADATIESLYPRCMRNQGPEPTEAMVQQLVGELKTSGVFSVTQKPDKVLGGYILRGQSKKATGDELVSSIEALLERKPALRQSLNVFYTEDFGIFLDSDAFDAFEPDDVPPILYVTGPDVVRPPRRLELSLASAAGLATSWYLAIYPFLLNPAIAKRVEEQLALADAGMTPDLSWLSQLSLPLFFTFVGLQLVGEAGHQAVAAANKVKMSVPTFVPSLITGVTSTVTTFKTPPPNKTAMFDIALAGPLLGILASIAAVAIGSAMTLTSDASLLPALPLEILRQSTLGGGLINSILGNGALSIPDGAQGTAAVASITIPLHPVAVAGYISLIVNALSLLPIGST